MRTTLRAWSIPLRHRVPFSTQSAKCSISTLIGRRPGGSFAKSVSTSGSFSVTTWTYVGAALLYGLEYPALMALAARRFPARFATVYGLMNLSTVVTIAGVWAVGRWTEAVGSMVPALSAAACGFIAFGVVAASLAQWARAAAPKSRRQSAG